MDAVDSQPEQCSRKARLLLLVEDAGQAAWLAQRVPSATYDVISCPPSLPMGGWVAELRPDLILLHPTEERTLDTAESVRAQTDRPIVVLSASNDDLVIARVLGLGIDEYLVLPLGDRELGARIEAMLRWIRRHDSTKERQHLGDLLLSSVDHTVERAGRKIVLSPIEFRLLSCLASAPGKVLTHQTLMARVWGAEYVDSRHYLRVYIRYLREKLEDDPAEPKMILSEWGVGYRFQPQEPSAGLTSSSGRD